MQTNVCCNKLNNYFFNIFMWFILILLILIEIFFDKLMLIKLFNKFNFDVFVMFFLFCRFYLNLNFVIKYARYIAYFYDVVFVQIFQQFFVRHFVNIYFFCRVKYFEYYIFICLLNIKILKSRFDKIVFNININIKYIVVNTTYFLNYNHFANFVFMR